MWLFPLPRHLSVLTWFHLRCRVGGAHIIILPEAHLPKEAPLLRPGVRLQVRLQKSPRALLWDIRWVRCCKNECQKWKVKAK